MDAFELVKLIALILQFVGILVGAGLIFERVVQAAPLKALSMLLNATQDVVDSYFRHRGYKFKVSDNIDDLYEEASHPGLVLFRLLVATVGLIIFLGFWVILFYKLQQHLFYDVSLSTLFWVSIPIWLLSLVIQYALAVPGQLALSSNKSGRKYSFSAGIIQFLKNWYVTPFTLLKIELLLCMVVILLLPSWVLKIDVSFEKRRQRYYLIYATIFLLLSTSLQIFLIVAK